MNQNIHYFYFNRPEAGGNRSRWATVAYTIRQSTIGVAVTYALAYCSPRDNFCKARGRLIASNRLACDATTMYLRSISQLPTTNAEYREIEGRIFNDAVNNRLPAVMQEAIQILEAA